MKPKLRKSDWMVLDIPFRVGKLFVVQHHYARSGSNTATYMHGLIRRGSSRLCGVAWWIPPTKSAALSVSDDWQSVLTLSRLCIVGAPSNAASFLIGRSISMIDRARWQTLVTYADTWKGHTGNIYRATNWEYLGLTKPERVFVKDGCLVARKAGNRTRTHDEMFAMGAKLLGRYPKHKFVMRGGPRKVS